MESRIRKNDFSELEKTYKEHRLLLIRTDSRKKSLFSILYNWKLTVASDGYCDSALRDSGNATILGCHGNREVLVVFSKVVTHDRNIDAEINFSWLENQVVTWWEGEILLYFSWSTWSYEPTEQKIISKKYNETIVIWLVNWEEIWNFLYAKLS